MKINEIHLNPDNPRFIKDDKFEKLKKSILEFPKMMELRPIIIDDDMMIIGGNMRYRALIELGYQEIPKGWVVKASELTEEEKKRFIIADNIPYGEFDYEKLANEWDEVKLEDWGMDLSEINVKFEPEIEEDDFDVDKAVEDTKEPICKLGDIWQLGKHRIMCGDSTSTEDIKKLMNGNEVKICFTSPPYNMAGDRYRNYDDNLKSQEYIDFNINAIKNIRPYLKGYLFWNISYNKNARWEWIEIFYRIAKETGINFLEKIVWDKGHGTPITSKKQLTRQYEDIFLGGTETEIENELTEAYIGTTLKDYGFNKRTGKGITNYWRITTGNTQTKENSACFPIALPVKAILLMSVYNDNILDPFNGLGSTLIACEKTKRKFFGIDIDPVYIDVTCQRWEEYTKQKAVKLNA
jgi:DNA modification methylase